MIENPACPSCGDGDWRIVGNRTYRSDRMIRTEPFAQRVLFELWTPGRQEFEAKFAGCRSCGMMIYMPRPSAADIQAKYELGAALSSAVPSNGEPLERTRKRADRVYSILAPHLSTPVEQSRILDFGGGDGRLLREFAAAGAQCELIDYCTAPVEGVRQVGCTEHDLRDGVEYDVIVCSHVVEHLAEPAPVLERLLPALKPSGVIYIEVPVEVRKHMPSSNEPVTHCNFFVPESLRTLMQRAGYRVISCKLMAYPHPLGGWALCAGAIASPGGDRVDLGGFDPLQRYLQPSLLHKARIHSLLWRGLPRRVAARIGERLRKPAYRSP